MKLGIQSNAYLDRYGIEKGAYKLREHGYSAVDYADFCDTETPFFKLSEREFEKELIRQGEILRAAGITVSQAHAPWRWPVHDGLKEEREERFLSMSKAIRGCAYIGCENFVVHPIMPFGPNSPENPEEMIKMNTEFMLGLERTAREYGGIKINIENLPFPELPINHTRQVIDFVKSLGSDTFKVCIDTGHCNFCGEAPADAVRLVGYEYLGTLHVHDNDGTRDAHQLPGQGNIDFSAFAAALSEIGFDKTLSFETYVSGSFPSEEERDKAERRLAEIGYSIINNKYRS